MTRESLVHASREDLIDLVLSSNERMEALEQQLRWFKQQLFGRKSERQIPEPDPSQLLPRRVARPAGGAGGRDDDGAQPRAPQAPRAGGRPTTPAFASTTRCR